MALPLAGGGFGAALLIAKPARHMRFFSDAVVFAMRARWDWWPTLADVLTLTPDDGAVVTQTSMICVRDGRWRVLGYAQDFNREAWAWPLPWSQFPADAKRSLVRVKTGPDQETKVTLDPELMRLDPDAGERCKGFSSYGLIEHHVPAILDGELSCESYAGDFPYALISPERLRAWRLINSALRRGIEACGRSIE